MKKLVAFGVALVVLVSVSLAACTGGTPKAPVKTLVNLDKLVAVNMTLDQVYALIAPSLKLTSVLYQAETIELTDKGNWKVASKEGGYQAGEEGPYQALFFTPAKAGTEYYVVFFKDNIVMAKAWFSPQYGVVIEAMLKGQSLVK